MSTASTMYEDVRDAWADALESGRYKQGRGLLRSLKDEYCCLGVLCELAVESGVIPPAIEAPHHDGSEQSAAYFSGTAIDLPPEVLEWAGLEASSWAVRTVYFSVTDPRTGWGEIRSAEDLNDDLQLTFKEIATHVRELKPRPRSAA